MSRIDNIPGAHGPEQAAVVSVELAPYVPEGQLEGLARPSMQYLPSPHSI